MIALRSVAKRLTGDFETRSKLRRIALRAASRFSLSLPTLATISDTDKWNVHWYAAHYQTHFAPLRRRHMNILEIGIGGYSDPHCGGESLRMWKAYFPKSTIYGLDIYDKTPQREDRILTFQGSQTDEALLTSLQTKSGGFDIVIDDGSHHNEHVITTFNTLFPLLKDGAIYAVEDTQTSYWARFGGGDGSERTSMGLFKKLLDGLNYMEFEGEYEPTYFDRHIVSMHFYHNLVFIYKGLNNEPSNRRLFYK